MTQNADYGDTPDFYAMHGIADPSTLPPNADNAGRYGWTRWRFRWACDAAIAARRWRCRRAR